jgi:hypothetical protein
MIGDIIMLAYIAYLLHKIIELLKDDKDKRS